MADTRQQARTDTRAAATGSNALQKSESRGDVAVAEKPKQVTQFEEQFAEYRPNIQAVLPSHIRIEHFERVIITAINNSPELWGADRRSLFNACVQAATDGLMPDGREGALVIYSTKVKDAHGREEWIKKVQWMRMVYGVRKQMRNSGEVLSAVAHVVYENDRFRFVLGDDERIEHEVALKDRGAPLGAYAIIKLKNGETIHEYMSASEVADVRAASKSSNSPAWTKWWGEMARKVVLRRASKAAPMSSAMDKAMQREDEDFGAAISGTGAMMIDHATGEPVPERPTRRVLHDGTAGMGADGGTEGENNDPDPESGEDETDNVPDFQFIDRYGEIGDMHHDPATYSEAIIAEMSRCTVLTALVAVYEHNEDSIIAAGEFMNEVQRQELTDVIRAKYEKARAGVEKVAREKEKNADPEAPAAGQDDLYNEVAG